MEPEDLILIPLLIVNGKASPLCPILNTDGTLKTFSKMYDVITYADTFNVQYYAVARVLHPCEH